MLRKYAMPEITFMVGTSTMVQIEFLIKSAIYAMNKFQKNIFERLQNVSETPQAQPTQNVICNIHQLHLPLSKKKQTRTLQANYYCDFS